MTRATNPWLLAAGWMSVAASLLHLAVIVGGPDWYRFFGAGERMARAAERGSPIPILTTITIATVLAVWAAFAFSASGIMQSLPLTKTALVAITSVLLLRAVLGFTPVFLPIPSLAFKLWSSAICLGMGVCFAIGTWRAWPLLSEQRS